MNPDNSNIQETLHQKFPRMRPIKSVPWLATVNGIGLTMAGRRDVDPETGTYVKTHCFSFLFIPLLALGAYRVANAERGWYFLGKESLSGLARGWNWLVLALLMGLIGEAGWQSYTASPQYQASQELQRAAAHLKSGEALKAAGIYRKLAGGSYLVAESREGLRTALELCLKSGSPGTVAAALRVLAALPAGMHQPALLIPDAVQRGLSRVEDFRANDPDASLEILRQLAVLDPNNDSLRTEEVELLKQTIAAHPDNTNRVVELALIYENARELDQSYELLAPYRQRLGATEGARILGQHLLQGGQYEEAYGLLQPYVQARLDQLHQMEQVYTNAVACAYRQALEHLKQGHADRSFYNAYEKASKTEQAAMVDNFIEKWMRNDTGYKRALDQLTRANRIVPVTLDLGIVQLNRAQSLKEAGARRSELEAAEKTFLAIRGLAGETDEYRLFLGQVYYWLGKSREGKELFDQLLAANQRAFRILMALGKTLRDVGDRGQAREMVEEAYRTAKDDKEKYAAAGQRAFVPKDTEDKIAWLEKCNPDEVETQIALNSARGEKALQRGEKESAAQFLHKASAGYQNLPRNSATLNNWGLVCLDLFEATGNVEDHRRGLTLLEEAVSLAPGDSILLNNTQYILVSRALMDVLRDSIRVGPLGVAADISMLAHVYKDETERDQIYKRLQENDSLKRGLAYLDKALLLAPKSVELYRAQLHLQSGFRDLSELRKLQQRLKAAQLDLTESTQDALSAYAGGKDKQYSEQVQFKIRMFEGLRQVPAVKEHPPTLEYVEVALNRMKQVAWLYGAEVDSQQLLESALRTCTRHQSSACRSALISAYFFRADDQLTRQNPDYAAIADRTRRAISSWHRIALLLERGGPLAERIKPNANVVEALALEKEASRRFPLHRRATDWALFRNIDPEEAALAARNLKENETGRLADEIDYELSPAGAAEALEQYWTYKALGDPNRAAEVYQQAVRKGVPLPAL